MESIWRGENHGGVENYIYIFIERMIITQLNLRSGIKEANYC